MKSLKESLNSFRSYLFGTAHTVADKLDAKWHLRDKAVDVNGWAEEDPKRFFKVAMFAICVVFIGGCVSIYFSNNSIVSNTVENLQQIPNITNAFDMQNQNDARAMAIRDRYLEASHQMDGIVSELDSLMALHQKTHADSVRISRLYRTYKSLTQEPAQ